MIDLVILSSQRGTGSQPPIETLSGRGGGPVPLYEDNITKSVIKWTSRDD